MSSGIDSGHSATPATLTMRRAGSTAMTMPPRGPPRTETDEFHVAACPLGPHVVARVTEAIVQFQASLFGGRNLLGDHIVALLGQARPEPPLIVDEELGERPLPVLHVLQHFVPAAVGTDLPAVELHAAAQNRPLLAVCLVNDGCLRRAGIIGAESKRLGKEIGPPANGHDDRAGAAGLLLQLTH